MTHRLRRIARADVSKKLYVAIFAGMIILRLAIAFCQRIFLTPYGSGLDDELMMRAAMSISEGGWLGEYGPITIAKNMGFSVWLAIVHFLRVPVLVANAALWIAACVFTVWALRPVFYGRAGRLALFGFLAYQPVSFAAYSMRVYRDAVFPAFCLLVFAGVVGFALRLKSARLRGLLACALGSGAGLAGAWLLREDAAVLLPFAICGLLLAAGYVLLRRGVVYKIAKILLALVPFGVLCVGILIFSAVNYARYGVFMVNDLSSGSFPSAYGAVAGVSEGESGFVAGVPATREALEKMYDEVPSLAMLQPYLQSGPAYNGFANLETGEFGGSMYFALRIAASYAGETPDAPSAQRYWERMSGEIKAAVAEGRLKTARAAASTLPRFNRGLILPTAKETMYGFFEVMTFDDCDARPQTTDAEGAEDEVAKLTAYLNSPVQAGFVQGTSQPYYNMMQRALFALCDFLVLLYAVAIWPLFLGALWRMVRGLWRGARSVVKQKKMTHTLLLYLLVFGLLLSFVLRLGVAAYMEVAAFNVGTYLMYLSGGVPALLLFCVVGLVLPMPEIGKVRGLPQGRGGREGEDGSGGQKGLGGREGEDGSGGQKGFEGREGEDGSGGQKWLEGREGEDGSGGQKGLEGREGLEGRGVREGHGARGGLFALRGESRLHNRHELGADSAAQWDIKPLAVVLIGLGLLVLKLVLASAQSVYLYPMEAPLDDMLMYDAAVSISRGGWLGEYNWLILSKHTFFSLWLAFVNMIRMPYLLSTQLLWAVAAFVSALAFAPVLKRRWLLVSLFGVMLFNPAMVANPLPEGYITRVYRDAIFPALCVFCIAGLIGFALRRGGKLSRSLPWLVVAGVGLGAAWLTREDGWWLLPFVLLAVVVTAVYLVREGGKKALVRCACLLIPFAILGAGVFSWMGMNSAYYGRFILSDFSSGEFADAYGAMTRIEHENWHPKIAVPRDVREKLYEHVPQMAELEPVLEGEVFFHKYQEKLGDYSSGAFYWALRAAAADAGHYDSPAAAEEYFAKLAVDINALCEDGTFVAGGRRSSVNPPIKADYVVPVVKEALHSLVFCATFEQSSPRTMRSIGTEEELAPIEEFLREKALVAAIPGTGLPFNTQMQNIAFRFLDIVRGVYALVLPLGLLAAAVWQLWQGVRFVRRGRGERLGSDAGILWFIQLGVLLCVLLRCFMIAFVTVSSFTIGTYIMYLASVHPLMLLYAFVGVVQLWRLALGAKVKKNVREGGGV